MPTLRFSGSFLLLRFAGVCHKAPRVVVWHTHEEIVVELSGGDRVLLLLLPEVPGDACHLHSLRYYFPAHRRKMPAHFPARYVRLIVFAMLLMPPRCIFRLLFLPFFSSFFPLLLHEEAACPFPAEACPSAHQHATSRC